MINKHLTVTVNIFVYLQTKMCVWMSNLQERLPSVHELPLVDQSRETGTRHSPAARVHSALWFLPLPAVHRGKSVEKDFTFKSANTSSQNQTYVWLLFLSIYAENLLPTRNIQFLCNSANSEEHVREPCASSCAVTRGVNM